MADIASRIAQKQKNGSAMSAAFSIDAPKKHSKNFARQNIEMLREVENQMVALKHMQEYEEKKEPFRLKKFENVQSRFKEEAEGKRVAPADAVRQPAHPRLGAGFNRSGPVNPPPSNAGATLRRKQEAAAAVAPPSATDILGRMDFTGVTSTVIPRGGSVQPRIVEHSMEAEGKYNKRPAGFGGGNLSDLEDGAAVSDDEGEDVEALSNRRDLIKRAVATRNQPSSHAHPMHEPFASPRDVPKHDPIPSKLPSRPTSEVKLPPIGQKPESRSTANSRASRVSAVATPTNAAQLNPKTTAMNAKAEPHHEVGKVPAYLKKMKVDEERKKVEAQEAAERAKIPKGCRLLSEEERQETLRTLDEKKSGILDENRRLPLRIETIGQKQRQADIQKRLHEVEQAIKMFSQPKVFVDMNS